MSIREAITRVKKLNREAEKRKGIDSESTVDTALNLLIAKDIITTSWNADGIEDRKFGIDKHIQLPDGTIIDLQVKSSQRGANYAKQIFPHIPVIQVVENESLESLSNRIHGLIQSKLKGKF